MDSIMLRLSISNRAVWKIDALTVIEKHKQTAALGEAAVIRTIW